MSLSSQITCTQEEEEQQEEEMTPQKLHKIRARAHKWLVQFNTLMDNAHTTQSVNKTCVNNALFNTCNDDVDANSEYDGFVVLNGGMHAGCTPYEVRRLLIDKNVLQENACVLVEKVNASTTNMRSTTDTIMTRVINCNVDYDKQTFRYGSTLPFVVVNAPMNTNAPCLSRITITNTRKSGTVHRHVNYSSLLRQEKQVEANKKDQKITFDTQVEDKNCYLEKNNSSGRESNEESTIVYVLPVPSSRQLWNQGSSVNFNCGFLFVVQCRTSIITEVFAEYFSKPVVGVSLFAQTHSHDEQPVVESHQVSSILDNRTNYVRRLKCITLKEIPGLLCIPEFLTEEEHDDVLHEMIHILQLEQSSRPSITNNNASTDNEETSSAEHKRGRKEYLSRRHVVHFNRRFIYESNTMGEVGDGVGKLPSFYHWMRERIANASCDVMIETPYPFEHIGTNDTTSVLNNKNNEQNSSGNQQCEVERNGKHVNNQLKSDECGVNSDLEKWCDQLTANYYYTHARGKSASGIAAHVDAHSSIGEYIFIVSLGSYTVMDFVRCTDTGSRTNSKKAFSVYIPARSLVVMSGESRYGWTHCIAEKRCDSLHEMLPTQTRGDRISLTWRRGRREIHYKANCQWPLLCDGREQEQEQHEHEEEWQL